MATYRDRPYGQMSFLVDITDVNDATTTTGGFQEVSGLSAEVSMAEYRNGNDPFNYVQKIMGLSKTPDVTLKRGVIGDLALAEWMDLVQSGAPPEDQYKIVKISLLAEDRETVAQSWTLRNARPLKYTGPTLSGAGAEVAVEELVLACEHIEQS
jgi:phage tail-like protein